jgi:hypothetical protein
MGVLDAVSVNNVSLGWHFGISPSMAGTIFLIGKKQVDETVSVITCML